MLTFGAAISTAPDHAQALDEVIPAALEQVGGPPGLAVWLARLPGVEVRPFGLRVLPLEDGVGIGGWPDLPDGDQASVLLLADPFTFPADSFLDRLNLEQPGLPV